MRMTIPVTILLVFIFESCSHHEKSHSQRYGPLEIAETWVKWAPPGNSNAAGFLRIKNHGPSNEILLSAQSDLSAETQIHTMVISNQVMRMKQLSNLSIPPGQEVILQPGGYHLMLLGLRSPLQKGKSGRLILEFQTQGKLSVEFPILESQGMKMPHSHPM